MATYKEWIEQIDINVDYYSAFIKAWIAFNSWYRDNYSGTDAVIIDKIKTEENPFRTHLKNLLRNTEPKCLLLQDNVGNLHNALSVAALHSQERNGSREQITFTSIAITNLTNRINEIYRIYRYVMERTRSSIKIVITHKNTGASIFIFEQDTYNELELTSCAEYIRLPLESRQQCLAFYRKISPYSIKSIIDESSDLQFKGIHFVKNENEISAGIIEVLYLLRCSLMHGDVVPNESSMQVYRFAYEILSSILKCLA